MPGEVAITLYEDANGQGDGVTFVGIAPNLPRHPNLTQVTTGLHGGCNRGINQSSSWSDCISSARVVGLPPNTKVQFFRDINYGGSLLACYAVDGTHLIDLSGTGDTISSFRIIGGNC